MINKARESLGIIKGTQQHLKLLTCGELKAFTTISQALDQADKLEETMKLIVRKRFRWEMAKSSLEFYNERVSPEQRLTETEFNQIKEVIKKYGKW